MKTKSQKDPTVLALSRAHRELILDASPEVVAEILKEQGEDMTALAEAGRAAAERAIAAFAARRAENPDVSSGELRHGFSVMLQLLRRRERLTREELAQAARISADEIRRLEMEPSHVPSPRTIYQLERFFKLPERTLAVLSGAVKSQSEGELRQEVTRFAAHAKDIDHLSREEKKLLAEFVRFLSEHAREPGKSSK